MLSRTISAHSEGEDYRKRLKFDIPHFTDPTKIVFFNTNRELNDQYLLPEFLVEHGINVAPINEILLQPSKKWSTPVYTLYRREGHGPRHGGTT
jgi:hypothetical protein